MGRQASNRVAPNARYVSILSRLSLQDRRCQDRLFAASFNTYANSLCTEFTPTPIADIAFPSIIPTIGTVGIGEPFSSEPIGVPWPGLLTELIRLPERTLFHGELCANNRDGHRG